MRLTNDMRKRITHRVLERVEGPRRSKLRVREHMLAVKMLRARFGDDVFERCRALPEGWLGSVKRLSLDSELTRSFPRGNEAHYTGVGTRYPRALVELAEYAPLPYCCSSGWDASVIKGKLLNELHAWWVDQVELVEQLDQLRNQVRATLASFTTVDKLAEGWPEGYAELPQEMLAQTGGLPAPRITDLNERIAALREAA